MYKNLENMWKYAGLFEELRSQGSKRNHAKIQVGFGLLNP
jgi:hypothetical protein